MLIEDNEEMLSLLGDLLVLEGYEIYKHHGGEDKSEILASLKTTNPDLVLLDVHLPGVNSFSLLHDIRQDQAIAGTFILMSSGLSMEYESMQAGADGFIAKPYMPDELITKIKTMIGTNIDGEET
jgi:DNA-binding response OmpR family regulator